MNTDELRAVAKTIVAGNRGVLAADESNPTIKKRFDSIKVESTEENRRRYRELLFTAQGIEESVGGVILFDETLRQGTRDGVAFATLLSTCGIVPGIVFRSGGQSAENATDHLNAMNTIGANPWQVSFSYGRALQAPVLAAWKGQEANVGAAQRALLQRCRLNALAREGKYTRTLETSV